AVLEVEDVGGEDIELVPQKRPGLIHAPERDYPPIVLSQDVPRAELTQVDLSYRVALLTVGDDEPPQARLGSDLLGELDTQILLAPPLDQPLRDLVFAHGYPGPATEPAARGRFYRFGLVMHK